MNPSPSFEVFLDYNPHDRLRVRLLADRLRAAGIRVGYDEWIIKPGDYIPSAIERALANAKTLILCLSPATLASDWVSLERRTALFRNSATAGRRFIPLLLADCDLPDNLRRYKYVDYRQETEVAFEELVNACRPQNEPNSTKQQLRRDESGKLLNEWEQPEPLAVLEHHLTGHWGWVRSLSVSADGSLVASGGADKTIRIWEAETGKCYAKFGEQTHIVRSVGFSLDGKWLGSLSENGAIRAFEVHGDRTLGDSYDIKSLAPLGGTLALVYGKHGELGDRAWDTRDYLKDYSSIMLWDLKSTRCIKTLQGSYGQICPISVSSDGNRALSGSDNGDLNLWDLVNWDRLATWKAHAGVIRAVHITPDAKHALSGSDDRTIKIWDVLSQTCTGVLEGRSLDMHSLAIYPDGTLVADINLNESTVYLWECRTGVCLQIIEMHQTFRDAPISVAFSPDGLRLLVGASSGNIYIFRFTGNRAAVPAGSTRRYMNAKVVLVGESGVGKSGLAHRLIDDEFIQTHSTHGMQVWRLDLPLESEDNLEREALLWDLAGQEDYRLIHQLFLDDTALALMLFNPQENDPFREIEVWLKVLRSATTAKDKNRETAKILIAARADVGGAKVSQRKIERFIEEHKLAAYLLTSAKRGDNCSDRLSGSTASPLKGLIARHIPWESLPWTSTPLLLNDLKNAVIEMREQRDIRLLRFSELVQRLRQTLARLVFGDSDVRTAVRLLANHGLVMSLKFGDLVLLRPEVLNGYAAAVIRTAREHTDEIGCVREQDVFERTFDLEGVDRLDMADEELLMRALVQTFLDKSLCIAEDTTEGRHLIFPSQYRRERTISQYPEIYVSYSFSGEWQTVYTTLVVRLWYSREFERRELWANAAEFRTSKGRTVGLLMEQTTEGNSTISVFFDTDVPDELKVIFIEYVHRHLEKYATDVRRDRRYVCPSCSKAITDLQAVRERIESQRVFIYCQRCDEKVPLIDFIEQRLASDPVARRVLGMDHIATRELDSQAMEQILIGHIMAICGEANQIFREVAKFDYGIDGEIEFKQNDGFASGNKIYVQLKSGASYLRTRKADSKEIFSVKKVRHLKYWVSQPVDVYLVVYDAKETIRWMNVTRYLKQRSEREQTSRQIVFEGETLDALAVWRVRDQFFRQIPQQSPSSD